MLDPGEERSVAEQFGVSREQVRRDHLISHLLAAIGENLADHLAFFGGTALSRSFVPQGRLSEDIDLIATGSRSVVAEKLQLAVRGGTRREFPGLSWHPKLTDVRDVEPAVLRTPEGTAVRIQLLNQTGYPRWPMIRRNLFQRYSDAGPATLTVPTIESFAAWKTVAWLDRAASRDLYDLWLLANRGAMNAESADLFRRFGPTNRAPNARLFGKAPDGTIWRRELSGQTRFRVTADEALTEVAKAWDDAGK